jgi:porin
VGTEWSDVFELASLHEASQAAIDEAPSSADCWEEAEHELLNSPCHHGGHPSCSGAPDYLHDLEAAMKCMAEQGFVYNVVVPQFYQGVTRGGLDENFEYGGKVDQFFILDGGKLWDMEGFGVAMHVETRYGDDVNFDAVGLAPVNIAMLYPKSNEHDTAITGLTLSQYLNEEWQVASGKFNALDMFYALYPQTGRGVNGFMNASMVIPIGVARVVPLSFMGAGVTKYEDQKPVFGLTVFDNQNVATTSGFDDMFENGANILAFYRHYHEVGGLPGSQLFGGIWATGEYASFDPLSLVILPGQGVVVDRQSGAYSLLYILEQTLWADPCNKNRNVGVLSQWSLCDEETSPFAWTCNMGIQAQGMNRSRPQDTVGIGYFHSALSDDFINSLTPLFTLGDVDGIELFYSAAVSECFHLTADLQVVEPAEEQFETAVVFGLRGVIGL